jgi:prepilin-type N-terminal cleavage/methylation domain-containing protein
MKIFNSRSRGVTLIELSIVLAILGVLIIATISGKSLIDISRATATMQQLRDRSLAFQIFSSTYDCIPGDCIDATTKITGVITNANGNGNTSLNLASATTNNEVVLVEHHLVQARLFNRTLGTVTVGAQTGTQNALQAFLPKSKIPNTYISNISSSSLFYNIVGGLSTTNATTSDIINTTAVSSPAVLQIIDSKADDGIANTGAVLCHTSYTPATNGVFVLPTAATDYSANCFLSSRLDF